jgi:hypothetical protein
VHGVAEKVRSLRRGTKKLTNAKHVA